MSDNKTKWAAELAQNMAGCDAPKTQKNRSGIELKPLYTSRDCQDVSDDNLGFPGQYPFTRGIYPSMYLGQGWSKRLLVGTDSPESWNARQLSMIKSGQNAINLVFCNTCYRGYDVDEVHPGLVGTCGTPINILEDMDIAFRDIDLAEVSIGLNDSSPFTIVALLLALAKKRGVPWERLRGTTNQSDFLSHYVSLHMFYRLPLEASLRLMLDHVKFIRENVPQWNPVSIVGQHMQQAGATPVQALAFTISTGIFYIEQAIKAGLDVDEFAGRFTFFFDVGISLFEEVAKFRAGRRIWASILKERFGAKDPRTMRFKFHAQTSGAELTCQQPLNNLVRVTVQAMAAILGGCQSLHTDSYDEALSSPVPQAARLAIMTQNILAEETGIADVIDPLGGSYYLETLTGQMEESAREYIRKIDEMGGMMEAAKQGYIQSEIARSALEHQVMVDRGERTVVGVNKYVLPDEQENELPVTRPDSALVQAHINRVSSWKQTRNQELLARGLEVLEQARQNPELNLFEAVYKAIECGLTHGEVVAEMRRLFGFGQPLVTG